MIICYRCGKENQDHYKFCLGCGAELTSPPVNEPPPPSPPPPHAGGDEKLGTMNTVMADNPKSSTPSGMPPAPAGSYGPPPPMPPPPAAPGPAPGQGQGQAEAMGGWQPPGGHGGHGGHGGQGGHGGAPGGGHGAPPPAGPRPCPACGAAVPQEFKFCGVCGFKMEPVQQQQPPPPQQSGAHWLMVLIRPDGTEGGVHELREGENRIGRDHGELFENDGYLSPTHAALVVQGDSMVVRDLGSLNGVFVKMSEDEELRPGQIIRLGQELLRFDTIEPPQPLADGTEVMGSPNPGYWGKITVVIGNGIDGSAYPLLNESVTMGRERGEINFPEDGYVSGLHARLSNQGGSFVLSDLGSSNGTFIRVTHERLLGDGAFILLGQQLFRLSML
ncbi:FHA domain-containing protein [Haliangium ochraceum]|uniref:FHA domain containing protein n=1 Tax=Haliangium ochraceum (strain DSM 14365 / JCM 11303 / SMP-2) TaxID=502025 RepID=D0LR80_HALO1|nr:FHA domain-containing protein [Haliangium ochraceum]ACY17108.1 FHA domain containing protein [Haliangium ochraceum DSM 14365]